MPALPALYRHYVPKFRSRLSYGAHSGPRSTATKSTKASTKSSSQNHDGDDPRLGQGDYLELADITYHDGVGMGSGLGLGPHATGPTTRIEGGLRTAASRDDLDADAAFTGHGIQKTVCLESYPQPAPPVYQAVNGVVKV